MTKSNNSTARAIFPDSDNIASFIDIDMKYVKPIEIEVIRLFTSVVQKVINNTDAGELFNLVRTMQMMIVDDDSERWTCLQSEDLGGNENRNELAQMIGLMTRGNNKEYTNYFRSSRHDSVNALCEMLNSTTYQGKQHSRGKLLLERLSLLKNFTLNLVVDLVEKNYALFNDEEKLQWIEQVSEEPSELFEDFRKKDREIKGDWAKKFATHKQTERGELEESIQKKSKTSSSSHENLEASSGGGIFAFGSNAAMMFPTLPISLEVSVTQNFEQLNQDYQQLKISASPSSSPKNSGKRFNFAEPLDRVRSNSPQKKEESRGL